MSRYLITWRGSDVLNDPHTVRQLFSSGTVTLEPALVKPTLSWLQQVSHWQHFTTRERNFGTGKTVVHSKTQAIFYKCVDIHLMTNTQREGSRREGGIREKPFHMLYATVQPNPGAQGCVCVCGGRVQTCFLPSQGGMVILALPTPQICCKDLRALRNQFEKVTVYASKHFLYYLLRIYEILDIKWLNRNIPEHLEGKGWLKALHRKVLETMLGTYFHSEMCSTHQPVVLKMLLPLLQFGREYRGGGGVNMAENPGQRPERQDTEYGDLRDSTKAKHTQRSHSQLTK